MSSNDDARVHWDILLNAGNGIDLLIPAYGNYGGPLYSGSTLSLGSDAQAYAGASILAYGVGAAASVQFAVLNGAPALTAGDFLIVG